MVEKSNPAQLTKKRLLKPDTVWWLTSVLELFDLFRAQWNFQETLGCWTQNYPPTPFPPPLLSNCTDPIIAVFLTKITTDRFVDHKQEKRTMLDSKVWSETEATVGAVVGFNANVYENTSLETGGPGRCRSHGLHPSQQSNCGPTPDHGFGSRLWTVDDRSVFSDLGRVTFFNSSGNWAAQRVQTNKCDIYAESFFQHSIYKIGWSHDLLQDEKQNWKICPLRSQRIHINIQNQEESGFGYACCEIYNKPTTKMWEKRKNRWESVEERVEILQTRPVWIHCSISLGLMTHWGLVGRFSLIFTERQSSPFVLFLVCLKGLIFRVPGLYLMFFNLCCPFVRFFFF